MSDCERVLATYWPTIFRDENPAPIEEVMPVVQEWVAAAGPSAVLRHGR